MKNKTSQPITRRRLLQAIVATSGAVAITTLPSQWTKPIVDVGLLPAHAQGSAVTTPSPTVLIISDLTRTVVAIDGCDGPAGTKGTIYELKFSYKHSAGQINNNVTIRQVTLFSPSDRRSEIEVKNFAINGNGFDGTISYTVCTGFGSDTEMITTVTLVDPSGLVSNQISVTSQRPTGASSLSEAYEVQ
jgi:hypothetical protein